MRYTTTPNAMVNTPGPRPPNQVLISTTKNGMAAPLLPIMGTRSREAVDQTTAATAIPYRRYQWVVRTIKESPPRRRGKQRTLPRSVQTMRHRIDFSCPLVLRPVFDHLGHFSFCPG